MTGLAEFYAARLGEDEAAAKEAAEDSGPEWSRGPDGTSGFVVAGAEIVVYDEGRPTEAEADHIARHDPARVLREVEAGRAVLAELEALPHYLAEDKWYSCALAVDPDDPDREPGSGFNQEAWDPGVPLRCTCGRDGLVARIRAILAAVWRDHPDFDPGWRP